MNLFGFIGLAHQDNSFNILHLPPSDSSDKHPDLRVFFHLHRKFLSQMHSSVDDDDVKSVSDTKIKIALTDVQPLSDVDHSDVAGKRKIRR